MTPREVIAKFELGADDINSGISQDRICPTCGCRDCLWADVDGKAMLDQNGECVDFQFDEHLTKNMTCPDCSTTAPVAQFTVEGLDDELKKLIN